MTNWYDLILYMLFAIIGACLMRWADLRVERAVERERGRPRHSATPSPIRVPPAPPCARHTDDLAPLPIQLNAQDADALRRDGAVVKQRRRV